MLRILSFLAIMASFLQISIAQVDSIEVNNNPYNAIYNHLYYLQSDSYDAPRSALSLGTSITEKLTNQSIRLKQILDGKGLFIDLNRLPKNANYVDSLSGENIYYISKLEPLIYLEKTSSGWFYSRTTIEQIGTMHKQLFPLGSALSTKFQAPVWQVKFLGIKTWKWLGLLCLLAISFIVFFIINKLSKLVLQQVLKRRIGLTKPVEEALFRLSRVLGLFFATRVILNLIPMLQLAPKINSMFIKGLNIFSIFFFVLVLKNIVDILFEGFNKIALRTENTMDDQLLPVLKKLAMIILWVFGMFYMLDYLAVNVTAILAGISIGGLALALAAQDTVKNFFGSVMIFLDRPFQVGDWIHVGDVDGTVEEVGVRSSRIRTFANSITYVPNAMLADSVIDNMGLRVYRRFKTEVGITYDTPPALIEEFVEGIRSIIRIHPISRKDYFEVHLNSFGSSSINILIYMFFEAPSWTDELKARHQVLYAIISLADKLGVSFAFPTQTIHVSDGVAPLNRRDVSQTPTEKREEVINDIDKYFKSSVDQEGKFKPIGGE